MENSKKSLNLLGAFSASTRFHTNTDSTIDWNKELYVCLWHDKLHMAVTRTLFLCMIDCRIMKRGNGV